MSYDNDARTDRDRTVHDADTVAAAPVAPADLSHGQALAEERNRFGGVKFGSAFFGWLAAFGAVVLLSAIVGAVGAAIGIETGTTVEEVADAASDNPDTVGIVGAIAIGIALFVAYLAGGYVAGRMARFSGAAQGFAVWLWGIVIAIVVALLSLAAGSRWDILSALDGFPRFPMDATVTGIITAVVAALITLGGAILGGILGMRYHRRVDRLGVDRDADGV
ncbi:hypothetical protein MK786_14345 [Microbacterium sp. CFH 31415]|uniref:hypothetical protein n=1 Tax=Microbacterium sp. CFH 31415 TaxID=2921732 RepID=UPI001F1441FA|nr:hypothetical protein [Microbacterium sp. CFH 31415]MCH6231928.1 hypothetical protein [Microbacterium sp. CFH 31415]